MDEQMKNSLLLVDDEQFRLSALTRILKGNYTLYTAMNGASAIKLAKKYRPDLILLDIVMPEMDGFEVITALGKDDDTKDIPVIFITGLNSAADEMKGLSYHAVDYIATPFNPDIVRLRVAHQIKIVNQLRTIERLVRIDQLTGIPNRRSFDERLRVEWGRAMRSETQVTMLMLDLDKFKNYNDTYGHMQGDAALQTVAGICSQELKRSGDFVARWGGEEFAALLANGDEDSAGGIAERIRAAIEKAEIILPGGEITKITVSIGVNTIIPLPETSVDEFISGADKALYAAKKEGRNTICSHQKLTIND